MQVEFTSDRGRLPMMRRLAVARAPHQRIRALGDGRCNGARGISMNGTKIIRASAGEDWLRLASL